VEAPRGSDPDTEYPAFSLSLLGLLGTIAVAMKIAAGIVFGRRRSSLAIVYFLFVSLWFPLAVGAPGQGSKK
jgi:hypothetical protein